LGLSGDALDKVKPEPDVLIIPNLGTDLNGRGTTALFEFVMKKARGCSCAAQHPPQTS